MGQMTMSSSALIRNHVLERQSKVGGMVFPRCSGSGGQEMPGRIAAARKAVAARLKDLEGNSDHHAERHEMQSALAALNCLEDETRIWPTAPIRLSEKIVLPC
jgi:hypothetical protein